VDSARWLKRFPRIAGWRRGVHVGLGSTNQSHGVLLFQAHIAVMHFSN
jgi:hypothetical protein